MFYDFPNTIPEQHQALILLKNVNLKSTISNFFTQIKIITPSTLEVEKCDLIYRVAGIFYSCGEPILLNDSKVPKIIKFGNPAITKVQTVVAVDSTTVGVTVVGESVEDAVAVGSTVVAVVSATVGVTVVGESVEDAVAVGSTVVAVISTTVGVDVPVTAVTGTDEVGVVGVAVTGTGVGVE
ncbi:hypothetical protein C0J52_12083 [Blattella germanica]|nr:hypothetical protein C0J52_12083 [Blattella germanica]